MFYCTGLPCKYGHVADRYVKNCMCVECHKTHWEKYPPSEKQQLKRISVAQAWNDAHRDEIKVQSKTRSAKQRAAFVALKQMGVNI